MEYIVKAIGGAVIGMGEVVGGIWGGRVGVMVGMYEGGLEKGNDVIWGGLKKVEWGLVV